MENILIKGRYLLPVIMLLFIGCGKDLDFSGLFQSRTNVDERFTQSTEEGWQKFPTEINLGSDSYSVLIAADCHVGDTNNLVKLLNNAMKPGITALFLAGDVTTGKDEDYQVLHNTLEHSDSVKYYLVVGNHDLFFSGWDSFFSFFGSSTYTLVIKSKNDSDLFIFLDTGGGTLGEKQLNWLKNLLHEKRHLYRKCVVVTHNNLFRSHMTDSTNPPIEEVYTMLDLFLSCNVDLVVAGHDHTRSEDVLGPTTFLTLDGLYDGLSNASYLRLDIFNGALEYQFLTP